MTFRIFSILFFLVSLLWVGCSGPERVTGERTERPDQPPTQRRIPLADVELTLQPSLYDEVPKDIMKQQQDRSDSTVPDIPEANVRVEEEIRQGFRIQVFSTSSIDDANRERLAAAQKLPEDSVYVVFDPPVYKVRVGDFRSRLDANRMLPICVSAGYADAWVVSDQIMLRKRVDDRLEKHRQWPDDSYLQRVK